MNYPHLTRILAAKYPELTKFIIEASSSVVQDEELSSLCSEYDKKYILVRDTGSKEQYEDLCELILNEGQYEYAIVPDIEMPPEPHVAFEDGFHQRTGLGKLIKLSTEDFEGPARYDFFYFNEGQVSQLKPLLIEGINRMDMDLVRYNKKIIKEQKLLKKK